MNNYRIAIAGALFCMLLSACCRGPLRPLPRLEMEMNSFEDLQYKWNMQGCAVYGDLMFSLHDKGICVVVDLAKKELVAQFPLASSGENNHANIAFFGTQRFAGDDPFPLLYVSQCKSAPVTEIGLPETDSLSRLCFVERVLTDEAGAPCGTQLVQLLNPVFDSFSSSLWVADESDPEHIWCFGNSTGNRRPDNHIIMRKFAFPEYSADNFVVDMKEEDVLDKSALDEYLPEGARGPQDCTLQGGCMVDGLLYLPVGTGKKFPAEIFIFDLRPRFRDGVHYRYAHFDYTDIIPYEPEDMDVWGDRLVLHVNNIYDKDNRIYSFPLKEMRRSVHGKL